MEIKLDAKEGEGAHLSLSIIIEAPMIGVVPDSLSMLHGVEHYFFLFQMIFCFQNPDAWGHA